MREAEFREWLQAGGAQTEAGRNSRVHAVKTIERKLSELGSPFASLADAWENDRFQQLRERIRQMRQNARDGAEDFRILMPESQKPLNRLSNWNSWLAQYGRFLSGEQHGELKDADRIRQYVLEHFIEPAREEGRDSVEVLVSDVNRALELNQAWPNICQALAGKMFQDLAEVPAPERIGADQSSATVFRFRLNDTDDTSARPFVLFDAAGAAFKPVRNYNRRNGRSAFRVKPPGASNEADEAVELDTIAEVARAMLIDRRPARVQSVNGGPVNYVGYGKQKLVRYELDPQIAREIGVPASGDIRDTPTDLTNEEILARFDAADPRFQRARDSWSLEATNGFCDVARAVHLAGYDWWMIDKQSQYECRFGRKKPDQKIAFAVLGYVNSSEPWLSLNAKNVLVKLVKAQPISPKTAEELADILDTHRVQIEKSTGEQPARAGCWPTDYLLEKSDTSENGELAENVRPQMPSPTNLILYGPPGTGKTFATAEEALRLGGEEVPHDRGELMATYRRLVEAGRIEFVTFHQSYAYEEFVEGLRPIQQEDQSAGFHLEAEAGVLRRVARRAETSTGSGGPAFVIGDRQVFKMSIGEAANPDDAHLFEEAIAGGYTLLGFEDIDWSDERFANRQAIIEEVKAHGVLEGGEPNAMSGRVQMPFIFRNWVKPGDIIVVSKGNSLFRAIGEVTGEYQFVAREGGDYGHRRAVRWLWVDRTGVPVSEIYSRNFTMKSIYLLARADLNVPALERYIASQQGGGGAPESFVLIIDEINRANVSKVMGELITLLEPDKRIGATNELRVRLPYSRDIFGLPANLHIIGTMNTADRSIALLDTALRRRFKFKEIPPEPELLEEAEQATGLPLVDFLTAINDRIEYLLDREHRIGHAYFINCRTREQVDAAMRNAVIPLLQEYFFEDLSRVAIVLGDPKGGGFLSCRQIKDPLGESDARDSWSVLPEFAEDAYNRSVKPDTPVHLVEPPAQAAE